MPRRPRRAITGNQHSPKATGSTPTYNPIIAKAASCAAVALGAAALLRAAGWLDVRLPAGVPAVRDAAWLDAVRESRDRTQAGQTAPAQGLALVRVLYPR